MQMKTEKLDIKIAVEKLSKYYNGICEIPNNRYLSWEHCYKVFSKARNNRDVIDIDKLCLHLSFYLASWGMYRGSSFLLQKDYKFHRPVVEEILKPEYDCLLGIPALNLMDDHSLDTLFELSQEVADIYENADHGRPGIKNHVTDTLVTKILLGTLGCVPAYDRYFVDAIKRYGIARGVYNRKSILDICCFYNDNRESFQKLNIPYPEMKLIDMCMWQLGVDDSN